MTESTVRLSAPSLVRRLGVAPLDGTGPAYRALAERIRAAVLDGRLAVSAGLPSERELAAGLSLSRTTVALAYSLLRDEGWLVSRRGSGSRLTLPGALGGGAAGGASGPARTGGTATDPAAALGPAGIFGRFPATGDGSAEAPIDLSTVCLPAPAEALTAALARATEQLPHHFERDSYLPFGLPALRRAVARRYNETGLPTTEDQILITNGAQHGFTISLGELSSPGDRVMIECPTYPVALDAIRSARRVVDPVAMTLPEPPEKAGAGWDLDLIRATLRQTAPRLAYLIPDFQNPTGALMDATQRQELVAAARRSGTLLVIDESFRDVPFPGSDPLPPPVAALADDARVITLGSVSKSLWGGLRIGWIRTAPALVDRLAAARALGDMSGPVLEQLVATALLDDPQGAFDLQRTRLAVGAATLLAALAAELPGWIPVLPQGGASTWVRLPAPNATELARLAPGAGVRIAPGPRFGPDGTMESYLRLPFTASPARLRTAIGRLASIADRSADPARSRLPGWIT